MRVMEWVPSFRVFPFRCSCCSRLFVGQCWERNRSGKSVSPIDWQVSSVVWIQRRCMQCGRPCV